MLKQRSSAVTELQALRRPCKHILSLASGFHIFLALRGSLRLVVIAGTGGQVS